ncbi:unnamed protein product [Notodromas monacha]|uniref:PDZ domain-containing protein n=1 Tax=Notodromas monacha TaxID=399045 RepID=A0A7R9BFF2_9CRUS|nr:unnamed protein product [Notodromas monacha]CAG0913191.1 unnamed protein product [Notodromas monacha]
MVQSAGVAGLKHEIFFVVDTVRNFFSEPIFQGIGISLVGGKVEVNGGASSIAGVFIKSILSHSPAEKTGLLFTGDRILEIDGVDLRNAGFEKATQAIKQAGNEISLVVQSLKNIPPDSHTMEGAGEASLRCSLSRDISGPLGSGSTSPVAPSSRRDSLMPPSKDGNASDAESAVSAETVSPSASDTDSSSDEEEGGRTTSRRGAEIDRMSAGHVKLSKAEKLQCKEEEDEFGYTTTKIKKRYVYPHANGQLLLISVARNPKLGGLGISLAGLKDRSRMGVLVAGVLVGDEILEINGTVVRGRCHLNVSSTIRQIRSSVVKFVILRKPQEICLEELAVGPISNYPVSCGVQNVLDAEAILSSLNEKYKGVRAIRVQKGDSGGGLGIMIIEGKHAAMGQGIFISDIQIYLIFSRKLLLQSASVHSSFFYQQKGSPAEEAGLAIGDMILYADVENLMGADYDKAVSILRRITGTVTLYVCNPHTATANSNELQPPRAVSPAVPGSPARPVTPAGTQGTLSPVTASSPTPSGSRSPDIGRKAESHTIVPGNDATIELNLTEKTPLGLLLIGERESPLGGVFILDIRANGLVAKDGRLKIGDHLKEVGSVNLREKTAKEAYEAIWHTCSRGNKLSLLIHRRHADDDNSNCFEELTFQLSKRKEKSLGLCVAASKSLKGLPIITEILDGSLAFLDGKLVKGDRIMAINGVDLTDVKPEKAALSLRTAFTFASPTMTFKVRRLRKP